MNVSQFEQLLFEEETSTLDFKQCQYAFVKAADEDKAELLKDLLGFANAWRRSTAFILIGVKEVRGGRSEVVGIGAAEQLDDHALQQFVNNQTNRPVPFHYEAFGYEGKQVGIIQVEVPRGRPYFLKKDFGRLKRNEVYVRRGSSTDPTKPAGPDEIAQMGSGNPWTGAADASLSVEFALAKREQRLGCELEWQAENCRMPAADDIPPLKEQSQEIALPGGRSFHVPNISAANVFERLNSKYYVELANYLRFRKLVREVRLVITNTGEVPAQDVRLEFTLPHGAGLGVFDWRDAPEQPARRTSVVGVPAAMRKLKYRAAMEQAGAVDIERTDHETKLEINGGSLQPGRSVWTDSFFLGVGTSRTVELRGVIYAANLPKPQECTLAIRATISETSMGVDELLAFDNASAEEADESDT